MASIKVRINELLEQDERNLAWLSRRTEITYSSLHKLASNNTISINFDILARICVALNCDIKDILKLEK